MCKHPKGGTTMNKTLITAMPLLLAALVLLPGALAVEIGFGGTPGSTITKFSSISGNAISVQNVLSGDLLASAGDLSGSGDGPLEQYFEWTSWDLKEKAAAYVYLGGSSGYDYAFSGSSGAKTATASLTLSAEDAEGLHAGGFAYNPTDYAAVVALGESADTFNYKNSLSASSSKVSATQTFDGTDLEEFYSRAWAERGNKENEATGEDNYQDRWYGPSYSWENNELFSAQFAYLDEVNIASKKPYTASASLSSSAASSSQSVTLTGEVDEEDDSMSYVNFGSNAMTGNAMGPAAFGASATQSDGPIGYQAEVYVYANGLTNKANNVVYSASSKSTKTQAVSSQSVDIKEAEYASKAAWSNVAGGGLYAGENAWVSGHAWGYWYYDSGILSSLSGTDSATAKAGSASVTQKVIASGAYISRDIYAGQYYAGDYNYYASAGTQLFGAIEVEYYDPDSGEYGTAWWPRKPAAASTLSGQSTATATTTSATVKSSGKWKATIAKDITEYSDILDYYYGNGYTDVYFGENGYNSFIRNGFAQNADTSSETEVAKRTTSGTKTYSFAEDEKATVDDATSS